jgi:hypothetical protein
MKNTKIILISILLLLTTSIFSQTSLTLKPSFGVCSTGLVNFGEHGKLYAKPVIDYDAELTFPIYGDQLYIRTGIAYVTMKLDFSRRNTTTWSRPAIKYMEKYLCFPFALEAKSDGFFIAVGPRANILTLSRGELETGEVDSYTRSDWGGPIGNFGFQLNTGYEYMFNDIFGLQFDLNVVKMVNHHTNYTIGIGGTINLSSLGNKNGTE